jgi:nucleotide-binding universal stress UspA family protein
MNVQKMLIAVDFSGHSQRAMEDGIDLAKLFSAEVHLVHAFDVPVPMVTPYEVAVPTGFVEQAREAAKRRLQEVEDKVRATGVPVHAHLTEAPAAHAIARAAEELGVDLIVMGTRGNTGLKHVILGSVAERTLRLAPCSVLTVKDDDDD